VDTVEEEEREREEEREGETDIVFVIFTCCNCIFLLSSSEEREEYKSWYFLSCSSAFSLSLFADVILRGKQRISASCNVLKHASSM